MNDLTLSKKIRIFSTSLTTNIIVFSRKKTLKKQLLLKQIILQNFWILISFYDSLLYIFEKILLRRIKK